MKNPAPPRGSALVFAMIVVLALTAVGVALIRFTSRELAGATAGRQNDALVACAEAGRQLLLSQFRAVGIAPTSLQALNVALDAAGQTRVLGGHVGANVQVQQVQVLPGGSFGTSANSVRDLSNIIPGAGALGGTPYRIVVHCQDRGDPADPASGRQLEIEFGVKFGL
ncbi:pilus assembly PilX N-terminal domain-containing protein [Anaeromyxobacter paludicola]|uniref:Type 4 fimbrial biogenesis protein PilX N-terminal domain-containing protein n=1 Tax=Anaeromyxobacter paludicola TaxID=2918171 RepID=A0ABM7XB64_9BACT|nr:pilus assembly PilX N-terminal domain-containing protein [Anaeromyxobacter paludicola]BDG09095.1 hypothetical protein AMPC_22080 [Anaeromyxobacter paludicola]